MVHGSFLRKEYSSDPFLCPELLGLWGLRGLKTYHKGTGEYRVATALFAANKAEWVRVVAYCGVNSILIRSTVGSATSFGASFFKTFSLSQSCIPQLKLTNSSTSYSEIGRILMVKLSWSH